MISRTFRCFYTHIVAAHTLFLAQVNISFHAVASRFILSQNTVTIQTSCFVLLCLSEGLTFQKSFRTTLPVILYAKMCYSRHI